MNSVGIVLRKELRDHGRDRRSLMSSLVTPLLWPLLFGVLFTMMASWANSDKPVKVLVQGMENAPGLMKFLTRAGAEIVPAPADFEARIRDGDEDVALVIGHDYASQFSAGKPTVIELVCDLSRNKAQMNIERTRHWLQAYSGEIGALRLFARGVNPALVQTLQIEEHSLATKQQQAANFLNIIPLFLLMCCFIGGMNIAIDTTAGERERGSLESLLLNPISRSSLILGKWLSVVAAAATGVLVTLVGFALVIRRVPLADLNIKASLGTHEIVGLLLALIPLFLFSSAIQMLVSTYARSFKEAQTYLGMLTLLPSVPGMLMTFSPFKPQPWMYGVPALGQQLLMGDVMRGDWSHPLHFAIAAVGTLFAAAVCLVAMVRLFGNERVVFGR